MQLYKTIENDIKQKITEGKLRPGDKLPSENNLIREYQVSKMTIRQCITNLAQEGYIYSIERVGNFISVPEEDKYNLKFDELRQIKGIDEICVSDLGPAPKDLSLFDPATQPVTVIERCLKSDDLTVAIDRIYLLKPDIPVKPDDRLKKSLADLVSLFYSVHAVKNDLLFEAIPCPQKDANILGIASDEPVALITQRFYDPENRLFCQARTICRSEFIELHATNF